MHDYYEILGVERSADGEAIKKAYRQLALKHHPDRNSGVPEAEERFKEATEAYEVLRDPDKRARYDRYGHAGVKGGAAGFGGGFGGFDFSDALNVFMRDFGGFGMEDVFGGRGRRGSSGARKGPDLRVQVPLTLAEVAEGVKKTIKLRALDPCTACSGSGAAEGSTPVDCQTCGGVGEVRRVQRSILGQLVSVTPCPTCLGEGKQIHDPCRACDGRGVAAAEKRIEVEVPAGVSTGDYLTMRGHGHAGTRGGPRGDVLVVLDVAEDPRFVRDGADLVHERPITFAQAVLGDEIEVPTVTGTEEVKVAPGTQSGHAVRLRGKGLPHLRGGGRGDLLVRLVVWVPTDLTAEQELIVRSLRKVESAPPERVEEPGDRGFWSRVKEAFGSG